MQTIRRLGLKKHPEGGYFRETYRANEGISAARLPARYRGKRNFSTAIYYLLPEGHFSGFHRLKSDEMLHFYAGAPLTVFMISAKGRFRQLRLGSRLEKGEQPQALMPRGTWFAAVSKGDRFESGKLNLSPKNPGFSLLGCTVAPGFDFADFEMTPREALLRKFPAQRRWILKWTH